VKSGVIFDLDQTLVDTSTLAQLRDARQWSAIYPLIKNLAITDAINRTIEYLNQKQVKIIVVTTSPSTYCSRIIQHCGWKIDGQICYHDVSKRKPDPEAFAKAIKDYDLDVSKTVSIGDRDIDIKASNAINLPSIACTWGSPDTSLLLAANPTHIANTPEELLQIITQLYN
jgi:phosphoglycolate phosphatase/pyrophosphatase PpaX